MAEKLNFIKSKLDVLPLPESGKRSYYYDEKINGLVLQVTSSGVKSFQVYKKINAQPVRVTLGRYPAMTIDQARKIAQTRLSELAEGINPNKVKKSEKVKGIALGEVMAAYLGSKVNLRPNSISVYSRMVEHGHLSDWKNKPLNTISRDMVDKKYKAIGELNPTSANLAMRILRALFYFAEGKYRDEFDNSLFPNNPVKIIKGSWYKVNARQTHIKEHELKAFFNAVNGLNEADGVLWQDAKDYLMLLLFTGLRLKEGLSLEWDNVDFQLKILTVTIGNSKNKQTHVVPLTDFLMTLLSERKQRASDPVYVFGSTRSKTGFITNLTNYYKKVTHVSGVEFSPHDLRRTFATYAESLDFSEFTVKFMINHKQKSDVTMGYIMRNVERRVPMQQITDYILKSAGAKATAEIIHMERKQIHK